ncbi:hypothetical protein C8R41DRAFT_863424 [Lentinula lateritia]|uniref:DUF4218 domain-containing protein n=1 Tax=Lentinula lateritia TaxID=40482 RepID=A0ABQ8VUN8_9AGAR|nr:hypothetical protein C8R41DRAFT_863424 [Lentinula lateritia]
MHHLGLNFGELLIPLWRGKLDCGRTDNKNTWTWATLTGETWEYHGKLVAKARKFFPSSFHQPPRNPAEKINSGFKATEYFLYIFGLGPGFFRAILPRENWRHLCKGLHGARTMLQRSATGKEIREARIQLVQFVEEYEVMYYQRRVDRMHFCRPCIHTLLHLASEMIRIGPGAVSSQYTLERLIGALGQSIRQPSNPFSNLAQQALIRCRINALKHMCPELDPKSVLHQPKGSLVVGNGYILLRPRKRSPSQLFSPEMDALEEAGIYSKQIRKWGRLRLPNGQIARSLYSESDKNRANVRNTRNVKIRVDGLKTYAEVWYYFLYAPDPQCPDDLTAYALVSIYSDPLKEVLADSYNELWACFYQGDKCLRVINTRNILSTVSMQPLPLLLGDPEGLWFVVEKTGVDDAELLVWELAKPKQKQATSISFFDTTMYPAHYDRKCMQLEAELTAEKRLNERLLYQLSQPPPPPLAPMSIGPSEGTNPQSVLKSLEIPSSTNFLKCSEYPKVEQWTDAEWKVYSERQVNCGHTVHTLDFLVNAQGVKLTSQEVKPFARTFMAAINQLYHHRLAPSNSSNLTMEARRYITNTLLSTHIEFRFAQDEWKVRRYITHKYPEWNVKDKTKLTRGIPSIDNSGKRKGDEMLKKEKKKSRTGKDKNAPPLGTEIIDLDNDELIATPITSEKAQPTSISNSVPQSSHLQSSVSTSISAVATSTALLSDSTSLDKLMAPSFNAVPSTAILTSSKHAPSPIAPVEGDKSLPVGEPNKAVNSVATSTNGDPAPPETVLIDDSGRIITASDELSSAQHCINPLSGLIIPSTISLSQAPPSPSSNPLTTISTTTAPKPKKFASVSPNLFSARNMYLKEYLANSANVRLTTDKFKCIWDQKKKDPVLVKASTITSSPWP